MTIHSIRKATAWTIVGLTFALAAVSLLVILIGIIWHISIVILSGPDIQPIAFGVALIIAIVAWGFKEASK